MKNQRRSRRILLKTPDEIQIMRQANRIVAEVLAVLQDGISPGISTRDLDALAEETIRKRGGEPAFKGYRGYPATLCISLNNEVVHGIPSPYRIIAEGDLVSLDVGVWYKGFYGDAAVSVIAGDPVSRPQAADLIAATREALARGIEEAKPGGHLQDISFAIQQEVEGRGFHVVKQFVGHGIGRSLHEPPEVPNYGRRGQGPVLREGMVLAIEPMVNQGMSDVKILPDGWTVVTADGTLSAHFEHSVAITRNGPDVLSLCT